MILGAVIFAVLQVANIINLSWWWIIGAAVLGAVPFGKAIGFLILKLAGLFLIPVSWWWILLPLAVDILGVDPFT